MSSSDSDSRNTEDQLPNLMKETCSIRKLGKEEMKGNHDLSEDDKEMMPSQKLYKATRNEENKVMKKKYSEPRYREEANSSMQSLSWRDPRHIYVRNELPAKHLNSVKRNEGRIRDDLSKVRNERYAFPSRKSNEASSYDWRNKSMNVGNDDICEKESITSISSDIMGWWVIRCSKDVINSNGETEAENVWNEVEQLYSENPSVFAKAPSIKSTNSRKPEIWCYTRDYRDKRDILKVANLISERLNYYKSVLLYYSNKRGWPLYMSARDGDLYRKIGKSIMGWKILND